jgi:glycine/D-amino acid oxidase-like deaminating enzyme
VIVGAGFAGAATAWGLGRAGLGPGVILEQEPVYGYHASGRNAALLYLVEPDPAVLALGARSYSHISGFDATLLRRTGGVILGRPGQADDFERRRRACAGHGLQADVLPAGQARSRFPVTSAVDFDVALACPSQGVVDIHGLLTFYLQEARKAGFRLYTKCRVDDLLTENGRVVGARTTSGDIRGDCVIDASGAWAGKLGRAARPLPLQPLRRHLFVMTPPAAVDPDAPFVWDEDAAFYFRPEGEALLFSPCDETPMPAGDPPTDLAAAEMLAEKLARKAGIFSDLPVRRCWACLRTYARDHRPLIGTDPVLSGLFHVSGLGGFGMGTSAGVGELAATLLDGHWPDWLDASLVSPARFAT